MCAQWKIFRFSSGGLPKLGHLPLQSRRHFRFAGKCSAATTGLLGRRDAHRHFPGNGYQPTITNVVIDNSLIVAAASTRVEIVTSPPSWVVTSTTLVVAVIVIRVDVNALHTVHAPSVQGSHASVPGDAADEHYPTEEFGKVRPGVEALAEHRQEGRSVQRRHRSDGKRDVTGCAIASSMLEETCARRHVRLGRVGCWCSSTHIEYDYLYGD